MFSVTTVATVALDKNIQQVGERPDEPKDW